MDHVIISFYINFLSDTLGHMEGMSHHMGIEFQISSCFIWFPRVFIVICECVASLLHDNSYQYFPGQEGRECPIRERPVFNYRHLSLPSSAVLEGECFVIARYSRDLGSHSTFIRLTGRVTVFICVFMKQLCCFLNVFNLCNSPLCLVLWIEKKTSISKSRPV